MMYKIVNIKGSYYKGSNLYRLPRLLSDSRDIYDLEVNIRLFIRENVLGCKGTRKILNDASA